MVNMKKYIIKCVDATCYIAQATITNYVWTKFRESAQKFTLKDARRVVKNYKSKSRGNEVVLSFPESAQLVIDEVKDE